MKLKTIILVSALTAASAQASVISVNFNRSNQLFTNEVAGVEPVGNWNHVLSNSQSGTSPTVTLGSLKTDNGTITGAGVETFAAFYWDLEDTSTPDSSMFSHYTNTGSSTNGTISITGLGSEFTNSGYKVILYLGGTDGMGRNSAAQFGASIGSDEQWISYLRPPNGSLAYGTFSSTTFATEQEAQTSGTNSQYIVFEGLSGSSFDITVMPDPDSTANWARAGVRGLQIVAVPEPSSTALLGLGGLAMTLRRRRK